MAGHRRSVFRVAWIAFGFACLAARSARAVDVTVDGGARRQTMDGFGSCITAAKGTYDNPAWRDMWARDMGCTILRVGVDPYVLTSGSAGDPTIPVPLGSDINANIALMDFETEGQEYFGIMAAAAAATTLDEFKVLACLWSPPHWMKTSNAYVNTAGDLCMGRLKQDAANLEQFGRYCAAWVKGFEQHFGVPVYALTIQNEPRFEQPFMSCAYSGSEMVSAAKAIGAAFTQYGISTRITASDEVGLGNDIDHAFISWAQEFINAFHGDAQALQALGIWSIHGMIDQDHNPAATYSNVASTAHWSEYWDMIKNDGKPGWMTETSGTHPEWMHSTDDLYSRTPSLGQDGALALALRVKEALVDGTQSAWLHWQFDGEMNPGLSVGFTEGVDTTTKKYCVAKHYYRYIRPGAVRLDAGPSDASTVSVSAFVHDANQTLTVVLVNMSASVQTVNVTVPATPTIASFRQFLTSATDSFRELGALAVSGGSVSVAMPAQSVVTLYGTAAGTPQAHVVASELAFSAYAGCDNPPDQIVRVENAGSGTLSAVSVTNVSQPWLTVTVGGTGNEQSLTNSVDITGLTSAGNPHTAQVSVSGDGLGSPHVYTVTLELIDLRVPENPDIDQNGLNYSYYEHPHAFDPGNPELFAYWEMLPDSDDPDLTLVSSGSTTGLDVGVREREDLYVIYFNGFLDVPADGYYHFWVKPDDYATLWIGDAEVASSVNTWWAGGTIGMQAGKHAVTVGYMDIVGTTDALDVYWEGPAATPAGPFNTTPWDTPPTTPVPNNALYVGVPTDNEAPYTYITTPAANDTFTAGDTISFSGTATDPEDGNVIASGVWTSSIEGRIGSGAAFSTGLLSVGTHVIELSVTDQWGVEGSVSIVITVAAAVGGDSDADGLTDAEETGVHFTDPMDPDSDNDGYIDGDEVAASSDPNDPASTPGSGGTTSVGGCVSGSGAPFFAWLCAALLAALGCALHRQRHTSTTQTRGHGGRRGN
jgi:O-glycosyl hydrolase